MPKTDLAITTQEVAQFQAKVSALAIKSPEDMLRATEMLTSLNKTADRIEDLKSTVMRPLLDAVAAERKRWAPFEKPLNDAILATRQKMTIYQTAAKAKEDSAKAKIAAKVATGSIRLETGLKKLEAIDMPESRIQSSEGSITFREEPRFRLIDIKQVPSEYLAIDEKAVKAAQRSDIAIPGIEYYTEQVPVNRR